VDTVNPTQEQLVGVDMTPAEVLRAAALYIERHGWTRWLYFDHAATDSPFPPACMLGGIHAAVLGATGGHTTDSVSYHHPDAALIRATQRHLAAYLDPEFVFNIERACRATDVIGDWNDAAERTATDVITALRDAANEWDRIHGGAQ
jgi:hypothetical protein